MSSETVLCQLNWTYGVNVNGQTVYFGPGLVPVPRDIARRKGWASTSSATGSPTTEEEAAVPDGTAVESVDVRARTDEANDAPPLVGAVIDAAGVAAHLLDALEIAGFVTAVSIRDASEKDLTAVSGIGKVTAQKLQKAAALLTVPELVEGEGDDA